MVDPTAAALRVMRLLREGRIREPAVRTDLSVPADGAEELQRSWDEAVRAHGRILRTGVPSRDRLSPTAIQVRIPLYCEQGGFGFGAMFDPDDRLIGLRLPKLDWAEPWQPPDYVDPEALTEQELTIGAGPFAVPGTLTLPAARPAAPGRGPAEPGITTAAITGSGITTASGPVPGVVLLTGSGPCDRDSTLSAYPRNKPFKDLAWRLAGRGIAVLRYDKVVRTHAGRLDTEKFTLTDEYAHAGPAITLLRQQPAVDPSRIFLLGHSLGGSMAPGIAMGEPAIAGVIILAGGAQPPHHALLRQYRYLASLRAEPDPDLAAQLAELAERVARFDTSGAVAEPLLPGVPLHYWQDWIALDPVGTAAALDRRLLVLQGGRDYQVTVDDDLALWRAGLAGRPHVTITVHEADDHQFFPGSGRSTPDSYLSAQHMDPAVVAEIAAWIGARPGQAPM
ncbi:S9 family peptidase [Nocardia sp. BMG111209]|uniref:alpha/beta hydrolase family protein n=1 Tax=Nocardia sp. BMG111209 TaxID=1160137 RepID=UPI0003656ABF|nr:alpha/beta fold hydrolase [Nocardia sp. BMG111209]